MEKTNKEKTPIYVFIHPDYETGDRCGAGGFQVCSVEDEEGKDLTNFVDQGRHYFSLEEVLSDLSEQMKIVVDGEFV